MCLTNRRVQHLLKQKIANSVSNKGNSNNNNNNNNNNKVNVINNFACKQALNSLNSKFMIPTEPPRKARKLNDSKKEPKYTD